MKGEGFRARMWMIDCARGVVFVSRFVLLKDEVLVVDGEDLQSCFNLVEPPAAWKGYMAFNKRVPWSVLGRKGVGSALVAVTVVPVGWSASVDLLHFLKRFLYRVNLSSLRRN